LRGPLPSDYAMNNDDNSHLCNLASSAESPWIHVWIPSTFLVQGTVDSHHVYQVFKIFLIHSLVFSYQLNVNYQLKSRFTFGWVILSGLFLRGTHKCINSAKKCVSDTLSPPKFIFRRKKNSVIATKKRSKIDEKNSKNFFVDFLICG